MKKEKTYKVTLNWSEIVEAENEEEAKEEVRKVFDSTLLNLDVKEFKYNTNLKLEFEENLSDNSIEMIKELLDDSLGFKTVIVRLE